MRKHYYLIPFLSLGLVACTQDNLSPDGTENDVTNQGGASSLKHAALKVIPSSQDRVNSILSSRAESDNPITLIAEISNPSREIGRVNGFTQEENGRYLSATSVYYDQSGTYYVTYHMQGNNYNTQQEVETSGFLETFTLTENLQEGLELMPSLENIYTAENPSNLTFDFNHLYFDNLSEFNYNSGNIFPAETGIRIIAGGHTARPTAGGKYENQAMIAQLNLEEGTIDYSPVLTGNKILDADGKSLGDEDAKDVNCIIRKWNCYYLATRKGLTALYAGGEKKFMPIEDINGNPYFIPTPGSAKYVVHQHVPGNSNSYFGLLYLNNPTPEGGLQHDSHSFATMSKFGIVDTNGRLCKIEAGNPTINNVENYDITGWVDNTILNAAEVTPMDGKNVFYWGEDDNYYVAAGKGGLIAHHPSYYNDDRVITFTDSKDGGSRPVNGLFVERLNPNPATGAREGFIYVANGACLTILDLRNLEKVAEFSAFKAGEVEDASANFVHVVNADEKSNGQTPDRIITVAYGQEGVKVFRFVPPIK